MEEASLKEPKKSVMSSVKGWFSSNKAPEPIK
jgi:hypothetical protein